MQDVHAGHGWPGFFRLFCIKILGIDAPGTWIEMTTNKCEDHKTAKPQIYRCILPEIQLKPKKIKILEYCCIIAVDSTTGRKMNSRLNLNVKQFEEK